MSQIDWFRKSFPKESKLLPPTLKLSPPQQAKFIGMLNDLIVNNFTLIPKLAAFFKEVKAHNPDLHRLMMSINRQKIVDLESDSAKQNGLMFPLIIFDVEMHLINSGMLTFKKFVEACYAQQCFITEMDNLKFLLCFKRLFNRTRKEEPELFGQYMKYVLTLAVERQKEMNGDLEFNDELVDEGFKGILADFVKDVKVFKPRAINLSSNSLTQAKYFLKNLFDEPEEADGYCKFLIIGVNSRNLDKTFKYGFGWLVCHLNTLCLRWLRDFSQQGLYQESMMFAPKSHSIMRAQALAQLIHILNELKLTLQPLQVFASLGQKVVMKINADGIYEPLPGFKLDR